LLLTFTNMLWSSNRARCSPYGSELGPENGERESYRFAILKKNFVEKVKELNHWLPQSQLQEVYKKVTNIDHPDFVVKSKIFYDMLTKGVKILTKENQEERARLFKKEMKTI